MQRYGAVHQKQECKVFPLGTSALIWGVVVRHRVPGDHFKLPQAAQPQILPDTKVAGVHAGLLRSAGSAGRPHRVGFLTQIPPPAYRHPSGPPLAL